MISGVIAAGDAADGPYSTTVAVSNGTASTSEMFTWTITPYVSVTQPDDQSNKEGDAISLSIAATDAGQANLTYMASDLPPGSAWTARQG